MAEQHIRVPLHLNANLMLNDRTRATIQLQHWMAMIRMSGPNAPGFRHAPGTGSKRRRPRKGWGEASKLNGLQRNLNGMMLVARYSNV